MRERQLADEIRKRVVELDYLFAQASKWHRMDVKVQVTRIGDVPRNYIRVDEISRRKENRKEFF